jgi:hypothetical protein
MEYLRRLASAILQGVKVVSSSLTTAKLYANVRAIRKLLLQPVAGFRSQKTINSGRESGNGSNAYWRWRPYVQMIQSSTSTERALRCTGVVLVKRSSRG